MVREVPLDLAQQRPREQQNPARDGPTEEVQLPRGRLEDVAADGAVDHGAQGRVDVHARSTTERVEARVLVAAHDRLVFAVNDHALVAEHVVALHPPRVRRDEPIYDAQREPRPARDDVTQKLEQLRRVEPEQLLREHSRARHRGT